MARDFPARSFLVVLATFAVAASGCDDNNNDEIVIVDRGEVIASFRTISDYRDNPTVDFLFRSMPRHPGTSPPDVGGTYEATGTIISNSVPGNVVGDEFLPFAFCLGSPAGSSIVFRALDPSVVEHGSSFIEGSGDAFTIYASFRSRQLVDSGDFCDVHQVVVISGQREADGSLSDLFVGQGIVGLVGDCLDLLVGDIQVAEGTADRTGEPCAADPGGNENAVELLVENALENPIVVFVEYQDFLGPQPFIVFPASEEPARSQFVDPGFDLSFESLQPTLFNEVDDQVLLGELVSGVFDTDTTPAGGSVSFLIENVIGDEEYYAPRPVNTLAGSIYTVVNSGIDYGVFTFPTETGLGCVCPIPPDPDIAVDLGYYSYDVPGFITPDEANVRFFDFDTDAEVVPPLEGPFTLEPQSGVLPIEVGDLLP